MSEAIGQTGGRNMLTQFARLARPHQWAKSVFVVIGPFYGLREMPRAEWAEVLIAVLIAVVSFSLASSGCYVLNDVADREADRLHPRKKHRPVASGAISPHAARLFALVLYIAAFGLVFLLDPVPRKWYTMVLLLYIVNVNVYTNFFKRLVIADVMGLSIGFVLRVMAGCAAAAITPSTWLLNVTFFLSMFLAFGKRLGERKMFELKHAGQGQAAAIHHRAAQEGYTDAILQMAVVVTAVATLLTYASYVQSHDQSYQAAGFNLLWLTMLPATYGLLRAIVLLERGELDDPTELALHDRPFQFAGAAFIALTAALMLTELG